MQGTVKEYKVMDRNNFVNTVREEDWVIDVRNRAQRKKVSFLIFCLTIVTWFADRDFWEPRSAGLYQAMVSIYWARLLSTFFVILIFFHRR